MQEAEEHARGHKYVQLEVPIDSKAVIPARVESHQRFLGGCFFCPNPYRVDDLS